MSTYAHLSNGVCDNIVAATPAVAAQLGLVGPIDNLNPQPGIGWTFNAGVFTAPAPDPLAANQATIAKNLQTHLGQLETWITNNPAGAVLTAGQTLWVAQTLAGLIRLTLGLVATVGQAN